VSRWKRALLWLLAGAMIFIGIGHFYDPEPFVRIVPDYLPAPLALVYISGVFEVLGGVGLLIPRSRRAAAWGLIALYVAVFPANLHMALNDIQLDPDNPMPGWVAWVRLPFQALFIAWAYWLGRPDPVAEPKPPRP
jgi:uncharacterized membrane protein